MRRNLYWTILALLFILVFGSLLFLNRVSQKRAQRTLPLAQVSTQAAQTGLSQAETIKENIKVLAKIQSIITASSGQWSVAVADLKTGFSYGVSQDRVLPAASTMKTLVATYLLQKAQNGQVSLSEVASSTTLEEHARLMIHVSDNASWEVLNDYLGIGNIQKFGENLGMKHLTFSKNRLSSSDLTILLSKLYKGEILGPIYTQKLLTWMQDTETEDRIPRAVPEGTRLYHKAGTFEKIVADSGIVIHPRNPFVIAVLSQEGQDNNKATETIRKITREVWDFANEI